MSTFLSQLLRCVGAEKAKAFSISMKTVKEDAIKGIMLVLMKVPLLRIAGSTRENITPEKKGEIQSTVKPERRNEVDHTTEVGEIPNRKIDQRKVEGNGKNGPEVGAGAGARKDVIGMMISQFEKIEIGILILIEQKKRGETEILAMRNVHIVIEENTIKINHIRENLNHV